MKTNKIIKKFPPYSFWWVEVKDEVSHEPDALVEVYGHCLSRKGKPRIMVRYVYKYTSHGTVITGMLKPKQLLRPRASRWHEIEGD